MLVIKTKHRIKKKSLTNKQQWTLGSIKTADLQFVPKDTKACSYIPPGGASIVQFSKSAI